MVERADGLVCTLDEFGQRGVVVDHGCAVPSWCEVPADSLKPSEGADGDVEFAAAGAGEAFEGFDSWGARAVLYKRDISVYAEHGLEQPFSP